MEVRLLLPELPAQVPRRGWRVSGSRDTQSGMDSADLRRARATGETRAFTVDLTVDELIILMYVIPRDDRWGDPLKDIYEMYDHFDDQPDDPYRVLAGLNDKLRQWAWPVPMLP